MKLTDSDWHKVAEQLPPTGLIVWVSQGGGTCLLARYDYYKWESATSIRPLPFAPLYWHPLHLPKAPPFPLPTLLQ